MDSDHLTARSEQASTALPWKVLEPVTNAVLAERETEQAARSWVFAARAEYRNAGHVPPSYAVRRKA
jgi:hypothetical protein